MPFGYLRVCRWISMEFGKETCTTVDQSLRWSRRIEIVGTFKLWVNCAETEEFRRLLKRCFFRYRHRSIRCDSRRRRVHESLYIWCSLVLFRRQISHCCHKNWSLSETRRSSRHCSSACSLSATSSSHISSLSTTSTNAHITLQYCVKERTHRYCRMTVWNTI